MREQRLREVTLPGLRAMQLAFSVVHTPPVPRDPEPPRSRHQGLGHGFLRDQGGRQDPLPSVSGAELHSCSEREVVQCEHGALGLFVPLRGGP